MNNPGITSNIEIVEAAASTGGCGCGGCGCGANDSATTDVAAAAGGMGSTGTTATFAVTGMTCGHCVNAVTSELQALAGVTEVSVELVADGVSTVTVVSVGPIDEALVVAALDEAGDYQLA